MNRKQKIIVSITGIFLVLMILVGLTYAYFLTKITGNTNTKSISVTTANLVLEYGENTNVVQGIENAEPGYSVEKIFTATNKGNSTVTYGAALESIVNGLTRQEDLVYTLTCTSYLKSGFSLSSDGTITGTVDGTCNGASTEKQFPSTSTMSIMTTNTIDTTHIHAYKLTVTYKEMNLDQSTDMNKTFSAKVNIVDVNALTVNNPYKSDVGTLKKAIIDNAMLGIGSTQYGKSLKNTPDDYGTSYYYYGNVSDNYVKFGRYVDDLYVGYMHSHKDEDEELGINSYTIGVYKTLTECENDSSVTTCEFLHKKDDDMIWRIVRINGDGSIRLILSEAALSSEFNEKNDDNAYIGYMYGLTGQSETKNQCIKLNSAETAAEVDTTKTTQTACESAGYKWTTTPYDATHTNVVSSTVKKALDSWYEATLENDSNNIHYEKYLSDTLFCGDKTISEGLGYAKNNTYYTAGNKTNGSGASLECAKNATNNYSRYTSKLSNEVVTSKNISINNDLKHPIGLLSVDEAVFAGEKSFGSSTSSYLTKDGNSSNHRETSITLLTPYVANWEIYGGINTYKVENHYGGLIFPGGKTVTPVINLKSSIVLDSGSGTKESPYTVKLS